jgi:hypothetical protein
MTTFPGSPKLLKGALIGIDASNPLASVIIFQYNPSKLTRTLTGKMSASEGSKTEVTRITSPPDETISIDIEIDATDQLEKTDPVTISSGIYPQLSALEMLLYPKSLDVIKNTALRLAGSMEVTSPEAPLTLFVWGINRVLPVRLTRFTIAEEAYDTRLNPIQAKVTLDMRVLNYNDFPATHPGYFTFMAHHVIKEALAVVGSVSNISATGTSI